MQSQMKRAAVGVLVAAGLWAGAVDAATRYSVTTVDVPFPGAKNTTVTGIKDSTWVGTVNHDSGEFHGWRQDARRKAFILEPLRPFHDINRWGYTIWNDDGHILTGMQFTRTEVFRISCYDTSGTEAVGMNGHGMVVGDCRDPDRDIYHSYTFDRKTGALEIFDPPFESKTGSGANDLNDDGTIVGGFDHFAYMRLPDGSFHQIHVPESTHTTAHSINNHGTVTGLACTQEVCQCFVRTANGTVELFNIPGAQGTNCFVISDAGELGGSYVDADGQHHGFVAKPIR